MGGKSGGGVGPQIEYSNKALDLQKKIYDQNRKDLQPYYQGGVGALNQLLFGIGVGPQSGQTASGMSRQQLIDQNRDRFTSTTGTPGYSNIRTLSNGGYSVDGPGGNILFDKNKQLISSAINQGGRNAQQDTLNAFLAGGGFGNRRTVVDEAGLNKFVDQQLQTSPAPNNAMYGALLQPFSQEKFQTDPGFAFRQSEGQKALERRLAAQGKTFTPEAAKALARFNQGLAVEEYGNAYNRYNNDQNNMFNRLATVAGIGQTSSGQLVNAGQNYANSGSDLLTGIGNAQVAGQQARANNRNSMFGSLLGAGTQLGSAYLFSDENLKENIEYIGDDNGHRTYRFNYRDDPSRTFIGVMAQEVLERNPEAVVRMPNGYLGVDYGRIGVEFKEVQNAH